MKVLFTGLGSIGQRHLRNLRGLRGKDVEISAWRTTRAVPVLEDDGSVADGETLADRYDVREFDTLDAALARGPDLVFVTNPNSMHVETALRAAEAGCDLFIEKPLSHIENGVAELRRLVDGKGLIAAIGYQYRFHPGLRDARKWIAEGRIGRVISAHLINGEYMPYWHRYEDYRVGYGAQSRLGGGTLVSQIHEFDVAYWMFGRPAGIFAVGGHLSNLEVDVEDSATVLMECERDGRPLPVSIQLDYLQYPAIRRYTVVGDEGRITWDEQERSLTLERRSTEGTLHEIYDNFRRNDMFVDELRMYLEAVETRARPEVDLGEGMQSLGMALGARLSMERHRVEKPVGFR